MLKGSLKEELQNTVYEDLELPNDFSIDEFRVLQDNNGRDIDNTIALLKENDDNLEKFVVENERTKLVSNTFSKDDVYDDFLGKNPKMNIYNSHENAKNFKYKKSRKNIDINSIFLNIFYDFKHDLKNTSMFGSFLTLKQIPMFLPLCLVFTIRNSITIFLLLFIGVANSINYIFYLLFRTSLKFKFFYKEYDNRTKILLFPLKLLSMFFTSFSRFTMVILKEIINLIMKLFYPLMDSCVFILNEAEKRTLTNIFRFNTNRDMREPEHIELLNRVAKISVEKLKSINQHDLEYLKKFHFNEFIISSVDYKLLPEGERKEYYKSLDLEESLHVKKQVSKMILKHYVSRNMEKTDLFYSILEQNLLAFKRRATEEHGSAAEKAKKNNEEISLQNKKLQDKVEANSELMDELGESRGVGK